MIYQILATSIAYKITKTQDRPIVLLNKLIGKYIGGAADRFFKYAPFDHVDAANLVCRHGFLRSFKIVHPV